MAKADSTRTDKEFSRFIKKRDEWCRRCNIKRSSDNSHFWGRSNSATRFDPKNCIGLCRPCHTKWEGQKKGDYKQFMIEWLGIEEYKLLENRANSIVKRTDAIREAKIFLGMPLPPTSPI